MISPNQKPEEIARDKIDILLQSSGWSVQEKDEIDFNKGFGQAIKEYPTDVGPAVYVLFVEKKCAPFLINGSLKPQYANIPLKSYFDKSSHNLSCSSLEKNSLT